MSLKTILMVSKVHQLVPSLGMKQHLQLYSLLSLYPRNHYSTRTIGHKNRRKRQKLKLHKKHPVMNHIFNTIKQSKLNGEPNVLVNEFTNVVSEMEVNNPNLFGFNSDEFYKRIDILRNNKVSATDSITIALKIPSTFSVNKKKFKSILSLLLKNNIAIERLLYDFPHILSLNPFVIENNLKALQDLKMEKNQLNDLLLQNPLLLSFRFDKNLIRILKQQGNKTDFVNSLVIQNLSTSLQVSSVDNLTLKEVMKENDNFDLSVVNKEAVDMLSAYDSDWKQTFLKYPELFYASNETVNKAIDALVSHPFYLDIKEFQHVLKNYPDVLLSFGKKNGEVVKMIAYLEKLRKKYKRSNRYLYKIMYEKPEIFRTPEVFFRHVKLLESKGFTEKNISELLAEKQAPNCFVQSEEYNEATISKVIDIYLEHDVTIKQIIVAAPTSLSILYLEIVKQRLWYLKHIGKLDIISKTGDRKSKDITLHMVIRRKLGRFVEEICGQTLKHYQECMAIYKKQSEN